MEAERTAAAQELEYSMEQVAKFRRPMWRVIAGAVACIVMGATLASLAFVLMAAQPSQPGKYDKDIDSAIRTAILTDIVIVEIPPGNSPGQMSAQTVQAMKARLTKELPMIYGGDLLTVKLQALNNYIDVAKVNVNIAVNTGGGISELTLDPVLVQGTHAAVHGIYAVWATGRHKEDGQLKDDRGEARYTFTAGLDLTDGAWLVTSWSDIQIDGSTVPITPSPTPAASPVSSAAPSLPADESPAPLATSPAPISPATSPSAAPTT